MESTKSGDIGSLKEVDVRKNIDYLRFVVYSMSQGQDVRKEMKMVLEMFLGARHRVLRLLCYSVIKEYADIDYQDIQEIINGSRSCSHSCRNRNLKN